MLMILVLTIVDMLYTMRCCSVCAGSMQRLGTALAAHASNITEYYYVVLYNMYTIRCSDGWSMVCTIMWSVTSCGPGTSTIITTGYTQA
jgi:hypothetical protein